MRSVSGLAILSLNPSLQMKVTDDYAGGNTDARKSPVDAERYGLWLLKSSFPALLCRPILFFDNLARHGVYCTGEEEKEGIPQEEARPLVGGQEIPVWFSRLPNCHRGLLWAQ
jgi:hypothetical protein